VYGSLERDEYTGDQNKRGETCLPTILRKAYVLANSLQTRIDIMLEENDFFRQESMKKSSLLMSKQFRLSLNNCSTTDKTPVESLFSPIKVKQFQEIDASSIKKVDSFEVDPVLTSMPLTISDLL